jgi:predicted nucleic acid-binding Zn finger protein
MNGKEELCYHLLSYEIASRSDRIEVTKFGDEEYGAFLKALIGDVFDVINRS